MKLKLIALVITATLSLSIALTVPVNASGLSNLFDSVQASDPRLVSNSNGTIFTGGNVRVRAARASYDLASFRPPSITSGCGGIDIFGGSFGLISKDQLTQTGRALVQSASAYYFGLALSSICPLCNGEMKWLQDGLSRMNQFSRASCEQQVGMIRDWVSDDPTPEDKVAEVATTSGALLSSLNGMLNSPAEAQDRNEYAPGQVAGVDRATAEQVLLGNSIYFATMNARAITGPNEFNAPATFNPGIFGSSAREAAEFFMSLAGFTLSVEDSSQDNNFSSSRIAPSFSVKEYFGLNAEAAGSLRLYRCLNANAPRPPQQCTSVDTENGPTLKPITSMIREVVYGQEGIPNDGVFERILNPLGVQDLNPDQEKLFNMVGVNPYRMAADKVRFNITEVSLSNFLEQQLLTAIHSLFTQEFQRVQNEMAAITSVDRNQLLRSDALKQMEAVMDELIIIAPEIQKLQREARNEISAQVELNALRRQITNPQGR
ncbi:conjugal transfer protein TraH [Aliidiomarina quisquiliarum]|uniref:conjugal transfer protein TraH n=1 Tax=Aliidiomarina quisquiliarum TaxID=2938947 RepID=UPI00208EEFFD|nr:conjugal transfer protein TraH [Aliidiomarina quisquiliarum]MCO4319921.1 conjugal transfer protein TraH [Aliidiomarina quisquiliarum]